MWNQNLPTDYVDALKTICDNAVRLWDTKFTFTSGTNQTQKYYIGFAEVAWDIENNAIVGVVSDESTNR